jgi:mannan endo-1,4-beta-mannosidase
MTAAKKAGLKVFRTWGFHDRNVTTIPGGLPQYGGEGAGVTPVVFQWWDNGKPTINIEPFDKVVAAANKVGIKLIVALTNNWADYGGKSLNLTPKPPKILNLTPQPTLRNGRLHGQLGWTVS